MVDRNGPIFDLSRFNLPPEFLDVVENVMVGTVESLLRSHVQDKIFAERKINYALIFESDGVISSTGNLNENATFDILKEAMEISAPEYGDESKEKNDGVSIDGESIDKAIAMIQKDLARFAKDLLSVEPKKAEDFSSQDIEAINNMCVNVTFLKITRSLRKVLNKPDLFETGSISGPFDYVVLLHNSSNFTAFSNLDPSECHHILVRGVKQSGKHKKVNEAEGE